MSVVAAYHVCVCALFVHIPPCTRNSAHTIYVCCHNTHNNGIFM